LLNQATKDELAVCPPWDSKMSTVNPLVEAMGFY